MSEERNVDLETILIPYVWLSALTGYKREPVDTAELFRFEEFVQKKEPEMFPPSTENQRKESLAKFEQLLLSSDYKEKVKKSLELIREFYEEKEAKKDG